jgi:GT2 family glycosyltransferase
MNSAFNTKGAKTVSKLTAEDQGRLSSLSGGRKSVSVVIPTKDRLEDLLLTIETLLRQTVLPQQIVVVDQSDSPKAHELIRTKIRGVAPSAQESIVLSYFHVPQLTSSASARNFAMAHTHGDIWLFLDDDVCLEPPFLEELLATYVDDPSITGVSGIITNYAPPSLAFRLWLKVFTWGQFFDERQPIYWNAASLKHSRPIAVRKFGSGLMSFRAETLSQLQFPESNRVICRGEDVDFCMQLPPASRLVINPKARLTHKGGPNGRSVERWLQGEVGAARYLFERNWSHSLKNRVCLWWLLCGYGLLSAMESIRMSSFSSWRAFWRGLTDRSWHRSPAVAQQTFDSSDPALRKKLSAERSV